MLRNKIVLFFILFLTGLECSAQNFFNINTKRGCAPLTVNLTLTESMHAYDIIYDFENMPLLSNTNLTRTYTVPGRYVIRLKGEPISTGTYSDNLETDTVYVLDINKVVDFEIDYCANNFVRVTITDTAYNNFNLDYGDGTVFNGIGKGTFLHQYTSSATQTISITGIYTECPGGTTTKTVNPFVTLLPPDVIDIAATVQSTNTQAILRYNPLADRHYSIQQRIAAGTYVAIDTIKATAAGITSLTIPNLNTSNNYYTFVLRNIDVCNSTPSAGSVPLHTGIMNATAFSGQITLTWQSQGLYASIALKKNNSTISAPTAFPYFDSDVVCGNNYCYRVECTYASISATTGLPHKSFSGSDCENAILTLTFPPITINCGYENGKAVARWETPALPTVNSYSLNLIDATPNTVTLTSTAFSEAPADHCYSVSYSDNCGNSSTASNVTCPIELSLSKVDDVVYLTWTSYSGYTKTGFSSYEVEVLDELGNIIGAQNVGALQNYQEVPNANFAYFRYRIKAISVGTETMVSYSNEETVDLAPQLHMPNAFTPNGDGVNDIFVPKGKYFRNFKLTVFNKWGEVIYVSEDPLTGWDGTYRNEPVTLDTYSYQVQAESNGGEKISKRGVVSVLR